MCIRDSILIENNSKQPETFRAYERMQKEHPDNLKVVTWEGKGFNYSALNNFGEQYATGEYLLLLNNDTEVISPRWIEEMLMYAQQDRVGCVGAKLLYPDDTIQHAGIITGLGGYAGHSHKYKKAGGSGYMFRTATVQDFSAVTGACLLVKASVWDEVDGLDEKFAVAFNDVDFCLRVRDRGYRIAWTPYAQLTHYESKSRGLDTTPENAARYAREKANFYTKYHEYIDHYDPYYNPHFNNLFENFGLK